MKVLHQDIAAFKSYDGINDLVNWHKEVFGRSDPDMKKVCIAGGSVLSSLARTSINDIDIYTEPAYFKEIYFLLNKKYGQPVSNTENSITWIIQKCKKTARFENLNNITVNREMIGKQIQLIKVVPYSNPEKIFATYDFNIVCAALHQNKIWCLEPFIEDYNLNLLNLNDENLVEFQDFNFRVFKYLLYGYKLGNTLHHLNLLDLAKEMPEQYNDYDGKEQQVLGHMPNFKNQKANIDEIIYEYETFDIANSLSRKNNYYDVNMSTLNKLNDGKTNRAEWAKFFSFKNSESLLLFNKHFGVCTHNSEKFIVIFEKYYNRFSYTTYSQADCKKLAIDSILDSVGKYFAKAKLLNNEKIKVTHLIYNIKINMQTPIMRNNINLWQRNASVLQKDKMLKFLFFAGFENTLDTEELIRDA